MKFREPITINDLIQIIRLKEDQGESYCIYGHGYKSEDATLGSLCFLDSYAYIDEENDYEEIYPEFVVKNNLELWFREELVQDVVENALNQEIEVTNEKILEAIKYYNEKDCFMDL